MERVAIYCRLSQEDGEKRLESESIQNQKALLTEYAQQKRWLIHDLYIDEDCSGANENRPEFGRLLADAQKRAFSIVLCKSQSRFTRDMLSVEKYIHRKFPAWGIRFVTLTGCADTQQGSKKIRQISGLIDEWYIEDLSSSIRSTLAHKRKAGSHVGAFALYGYRKDLRNKNQLVVDLPAAAVVRRIFQLYLDGYSKQRICDILNTEYVPTPTRYKQLLGWNYANGSAARTPGVWHYATVDRILREEMYIGHLIQGRKKKPSYKSMRLVRVPREGWVVVPNSHEAIIETEIFYAVQAMLKAHTRASRSGQVPLLSGKVKCAACGSAMVQYSRFYKGETRYYLRCSQYKKDRKSCTSHSVRLDVLEKEVARQIECCMAENCRMKPLFQHHGRDGLQMRHKALQEEAALLQAQIERRRKAMMELYSDRVSGLLPAGQFAEINLLYHIEQNEMQLRLDVVLSQTAELAEQLNDLKKDTALSKEMEFNRGTILRLISSVEVGGKDAQTNTQAIRVNWLHEPE